MAAPTAETTLPPLQHKASAFGWHTSPPEGRLARHMHKDREMREKATLANRREGFQRYECRRNPMEALANAASWVPECERLRTDPPNELLRERQAEGDCKKEFWERRRARRIRRESDRWQALDHKDAKEHRRQELLVGTGRRNQGSVPYDLVSHRFGNSNDAATAKYRDDCVEYLAKCRTRNLFQKNNASGYNILTGQSTAGFVKVPPVPARPVVG
eukprot:TRINITY_DN11402_c0_g1_i1.p3 TRINITY_DN11402_c0_g1~~TRINITY_DN11402_c0_g1_i1.p3  ORF type:complete len:238 (+),score=65.52 TRINITY_DN11402_c0_g1_i1:69-716(+)